MSHPASRTSASTSSSTFAFCVGLIPIVSLLLGWHRPPSPEDLDWQLDLALVAMAVELAVIIWAWKKWGSPFRLLAGWPLSAHVALVLVVVAAMGSVVIPGRMGMSFVAIRTLFSLSHLVFALSLVSVLSTNPLRGSYLKGVLVGWLVVAIAALFYLVTIPNDPSFDWSNFGFVARNIRPFGILMMVGAATAIGAAAALTGRWKTIAITTFMASAALCFWSGSRGPAYALLVAIVIAVALRPADQRSSYAKLASGGLVASFGLALLHQPPDPALGALRLIGLGDRAIGDGSGRLDLWRQTIASFRDMPIVGYGDGRFNLVVHFDPPYFFPHNLMLQAWFQWGLIGGSAALFLIAYWLKTSFVSARSTNPAILAGLVPTVAILLSALLDGTLYNVFTTFCFASALALAQSANFGEPRAD